MAATECIEACTLGGASVQGSESLSVSEAAVDLLGLSAHHIHLLRRMVPNSESTQSAAVEERRGTCLGGVRGQSGQMGWTPHKATAIQICTSCDQALQSVVSACTPRATLNLESIFYLIMWGFFCF